MSLLLTGVDVQMLSSSDDRRIRRRQKIEDAQSLNDEGTRLNEEHHILAAVSIFSLHYCARATTRL
jgi:hypothetical protein